MTSLATPDRIERVTLWGFVFLIVSVPLVPYRYLTLPAWAPYFAGTVLHHLPTVASVLLCGFWLWRLSDFRTDQLPLGGQLSALLLAGLLSSVGAREPVLSVVKTLYYFVTGGFLFIVLVDMVRQRNHGGTLLYCLLGSGYMVALYGIVEFATEGDMLYSGFFNMDNAEYRRLVPDPWFERRIMSTVGHPVVLGAYLALLLPISVAAATAFSKRRMQVVLSLGTASLAAALLMTFSRGAWIAAAVGVGVLLLLRGSRRLLMQAAAVTAISAILLTATSVSKVAEERVKDAYQSYVLNFGSTTRGAAYGYAAVIANREPMMGLGTGMYRFAAYDLRRELDIPTPLGVLDTPDNMYLMWLAENGGIGIVAAVYVFVVLLQALLRWAKEETSDARQLLSFGFIAAFVGFMVNLLTVDALYFPMIRTVFWIVAGVAVVIARPANPAREEEGKSR